MESAEVPKKEIERLSPAEFGKKVSVSRQRVLRAIKDGVLTPESYVKRKVKGKDSFRLNPEVASLQWSAHIDPAKQRPQTNKTEAVETTEAANNTASNYQKAKAAKEVFAAKIMEANYRKLAGELVNAEDVRRESFKIARRVRDSILGVAERVSPELVTMDDQRVIAIYIKEQLAVALKDLGNITNVTDTE